MKDEAEFVGVGCTFVFVDHAAVGVLRAVIGVLATDEGEAHGARIVRGGSSEGAADAAAVSCRVGEAVEVGARGLEIADQDASGPVGGGGDGGAGCGDYFLEGGVFS